MEKVFIALHLWARVKRSSLGEQFTPLGDHQKFKEMQSFKQLRDRERYLLQELHEEKKRRAERSAAATQAAPNAEMAKAIAEHLAAQRPEKAPRMPKSMARTAQIHPSLASVYANAPAAGPSAMRVEARPADMAAVAALPAVFRAKALATLASRP